MEKTDLSQFNNSWYNPGGIIKRGLWYMVNVCFFINPLFPFLGIKLVLLKTFGARVGKGVRIKPSVNIKYPWNLELGDNVWIGENVWIDCLGKVIIGSNSCISQGALLLSGNHNYKKTSFDLIVKDIVLEDGVWVGAKSIVTQGIICKSHSVLAAGSVATKDLETYSVYQGNPAEKIRDRSIRA